MRGGAPSLTARRTADLVKANKLKPSALIRIGYDPEEIADDPEPVNPEEKIDEKPAIKRAISAMPVTKPIRINAPNSVFALGNMFAKS